MSLTSLVTTAAATHEASVPPLVVGAGALGILLAVLGILLVFGGGREHS